MINISSPNPQSSLSLPAEIILHIFQLLDPPTQTPEDPYLWDNATHTTWVHKIVALSNMCRAFRAAALATPTLWTCLHLRRNQAMSKNDDVLGVILDRSMGHHLSLSIDLTDDISIDRALNPPNETKGDAISLYFQAVSSRLHTLRLRFNRDDVSPIEHVFREADAEGLRVLELNCPMNHLYQPSATPVVYMFDYSSSAQVIHPFL
jgi:hypothetical protein